jgi:RsiW-degrading membrane proteinase PrsW (M82 family)
LVAIGVLWWLDRYEKEPLWLLSIAFFWGAVPTIALSLLVQILVDPPLAAALGHSILYPLANLSLVAPLTEETFKALLLLVLFVYYRQEFDGVMDGILYGALIGFGFSVVENVFYLMGSLTQGGGWSEWGMTLALRVGLYNLNHSVFTACVGIGFGLARTSRKTRQKWLYPMLGWVVAVTLHAIHNAGTVFAEVSGGIALMLLTAVDWVGVLAVLVLIFVTTRQERLWFGELASEIARGTITPDEYQLASTYRLRFARGWDILTRYGPHSFFLWSRYVQMIVDLAYKKHQKRVAGEGAGADARIASLRANIASVRLKLPAVGG